MLFRIGILIPLCAIFNTGNGARILGIFPMAAPSHYILGNALMRGLAEAGHNVTMISPFEEKNPPKRGSYRDVVLTGFAEEFDKLLKQINLLENKKQSPMLRTFRVVSTMTTKMGEDFFNNENVKKLLQSDEKFDLVIIEQFLNDGMKIFGHIYNAPMVGFSSVGANPTVNHVVGNPSPLSYVPEMGNSDSQFMTFSERLLNVFKYLFSKAMERFVSFPEQNRILKKYFPNPPDISELFHNISLVLLNSHESLNQPVPYVPNMISIGGYHVKPPKKLPEDLQTFLDDAKEGVVYFSMGSNIRSKNLPPHKRDIFLTAFSKLKHKVLWKWEDDNLPGKPSNVKTSKWLPQQDILAHPNVKLFITHSGLLSTTETIYHGVPMLAIPVFADQHKNAQFAVSSGYALALPYEDPSFSEEKLSELLQELLNNPKYTDNVKKRSQLFHDRPMKPMDTAVYWVEYVIRNKGASHLRVAAVGIPWFFYHSLDVISFIAVTLSLISYLLYICIKKIITLRNNCRAKKNKAKIN